MGRSCLTLGSRKVFTKTLTIEVRGTQEENSNEQRMAGREKSHNQPTGAQRSLRSRREARLADGSEGKLGNVKQ